jgi:hypothetical protein
MDCGWAWSTAATYPDIHQAAGCLHEAPRFWRLFETRRVSKARQAMAALAQPNACTVAYLSLLRLAAGFV